MATDLHARAIISAVDRVSGPLGAMAGKFKGLTTGIAAAGTAAVTAGRSLTMGFTLPAGLAVHKGLEFDDAMGDLAKVFMGTNEQLASTERQIMSFARSIPLSQTELAKLYTAANQANVALNEQSGFVKLAAQFMVAFDTSADEAALSLARLKSSQGLTVDGLRELSGVMNIVANNSAATEGEMLDLASRVASLGKVAGGPDAVPGLVALGGAAVSMGVDAERAATGLRNMLLGLSGGQSATKRTKEGLKQIGLTAVGVQKALSRDTTGTLLDVFERIQKLPQERHLSVLQDLFGARAVDALGPLLGNLKELARILTLASDKEKAWLSLQLEYEKKMERLRPQLQLMDNAFLGVAIAFTERWTPALVAGAHAVTDFVNSLKEMGPVANAAFDAFGSLAIAGPALWLAGTALKGIAGGIAAIGTAITFGGGVPLAAVAAIAGAGLLIYRNWEDVAPAWERLSGAASSLGSSLKELGGTITGLDFGGQSLIPDWASEESVIKGVTVTLNGMASALERVKRVADAFASKGLTGGVSQLLEENRSAGEAIVEWGKGVVQVVPGSLADKILDANSRGGAAILGGVGSVGKALIGSPSVPVTARRNFGSISGPSVPVVPRAPQMSSPPTSFLQKPAPMSPLVRDLGGAPIDVTGKVTADVTGKVGLEGKADVNVNVRVQGPGQVTGMSATSEGHIRADVGVSMSDSAVKP